MAPSATPTPTGSVRPTAVLSVAGVDVDGQHLTVAGSVDGIAEDGGTCTFRITPDSGDPVVATSTGAANRDATTCGSTQIPIASFHRGHWTATLVYHSGRVDSTSSPIDVEVP